METIFVALAACFAICVTAAAGQSEPRCFSFTWLGPRWTNTSSFANATCDGLTELASGVPCIRPLVVSHDGTWPDIDHIWTLHRENASCILDESDVCAQYTYYFDGKVENSTYMCTRAISTEGVAIKSGCYEQKNGSFGTKVCLCRSTAGAMPCNHSVLTIASISLILSLIILLIDHYFGFTCLN